MSEPTTGLKIAPAALTRSRSGVRSRERPAAAEYELTVGAELLTGADEFMPAMLTAVRTAGRDAPKVLDELAGFGLLRGRLTVSTPVVPIA